LTTRPSPFLLRMTNNDKENDCPTQSGITQNLLSK